MTIYLDPERPSAAAYRRGLAAGEEFTARELTPRGDVPIENGTVAFSTPHYPKPHKHYGKATVVNGKVVKIHR